MSGTYIRYPSTGTTINKYATAADLPASAADGTLAIVLDTHILYEYNILTMSWVAIGGPGSVLSIGTIDSASPSANGAVINASSQLVLQSASATVPGLVNLTTQTFAGNKTFTGSISASNLSGTNTGDVTLGTANGLSILGQVLSLGLSSTSTTGALSSTDWNTFNNKQAAGNYITALTGDVTATGPGSVAATLATVNSNVGSFTNSNITVNAKGLITAASSGAIGTQVNQNLYVDKSRTDTYTANGTIAFPFKTITAAINRVISNGDNSSKPYTINIIPGAYAETLTFNSSALYNITLTSTVVGTTGFQNVSISGISSTSNNTQLGTLVFSGMSINGPVNLTGDVNGTNFGSTQIIFDTCQFNNDSSTIVFNNVNNISIYDSQIQGASSVSTYTNVALAYITSGEGYVAGTTLHLVNNNAGNQPSQFFGNYLLLYATKHYATTTVDADSELDCISTYFGSGGSIANSGTLHSFACDYSADLTLNNGSSSRFRADVVNGTFTQNSGASVSTQGNIFTSSETFGQIATPSSPPSGSDILYFKSDDKLYRKTNAGTETLIGPITTGNLTDAGTDGIVITGGTGAVVGSGTSIAQHVADSTHNGYLSSTDWSTFNGKQAAGNYITALTGDATASGPGSAALTLATVNGNVGSFGSSTSIPSFTVNAKGLVTAASGNAVIAPAGTLTGTTLASNVVSSSLTSVGTITSGTWNGTTIAIANGGTGQTTKAAAFDALSPMTTGGDIIYGGASGTGTRLANGSAGQVLTSNGGTAAPSWQATASSNLTVTSQTSTYSILTTDDVVLCSGAAFTVTLPTAVGVSGKQYRIKKTDASTTNAITIATTSSQTIDGNTTKVLATQFEEYYIVSDGANWQVLSHVVLSRWDVYTPTFTGFGTVSNVNILSRRVGDSLQITGTFTSGTTTGTEARMTLGYGGTNSNVTSSTGKIPAIQHCGSGTYGIATANTPTMLIESNVGYITFGQQGSGSAGLTKALGSGVLGNTTTMSVNALVPIATWEG